MSSDGSDARSTPEEWARLESALGRLLARHDEWRARAHAAERRIGELESALADVSSGGLDPVALSERAQTMERENRVLTKKLTQAGETVQRILARLQFLEDDR
jgi:predicted RNase H-like nuclease (RuvC/YqgF family)